MQLILTGEMTYTAARAAFAEVWPRLDVFWYRPSIEHYKEGFPPAEEFELQPDEPLIWVPGRQAVLRGDMTCQFFHAAIMSAFSLETNFRTFGLHAVWMATLDEANAGIRRSARDPKR